MSEEQSAHPTTPMFLFRRENGGLMRKKLNIIKDEHNRLIIESEEYANGLPPGLTQVSAAQAALGPQVQSHQGPNGETIIDRVSPEYFRVFRLLQGNGDCWYEGCQALLEAYQKELEQLGPTCPECQKGTITRKYIELIQNAAPK